MITKRMKPKLILIVCTVLILYTNSCMGAKSGPYKASYTRIEECSNPTLPVDKNPPSKFYAELYNTSTETNLMRGTTTIYRDHRIKRSKARTYMWENNKWKVKYMINSIGCNRIFFPAIAGALGIKYDLNTCSFYKGVYAYSNYNIDKIQHVWMRTQEYGKLMWRVEMFSDAGTVFCYDFETIIEPIHK